jgi:hypothetical protein
MENSPRADGFVKRQDAGSGVQPRSGYRLLAPTLTGSAEQTFFDRVGLLWFLRVSQGSLQAQRTP